MPRGIDLTPVEIKSICDRYLAGESYFEMGVPSSTAYAILVKNGIKIRDRAETLHKKMAARMMGKKFGRLTVVGRDDSQYRGVTRWICECLCGKKISVNGNNLRTGARISCGCARIIHGCAIRSGATREYRLWNAAKTRAKRLGREFSIKISDIHIPQTCPVLGIPLFYGKKVFTDNSPSVDRIDSNKGYTKDNIAVISCRANRIKHNLTADELDLISAYMRKHEAIINRINLEKEVVV